MVRLSSSAPPPPTRRGFVAGGLALAVAAAAAPAWGAEFPVRPVRLVVGFAAGGPSDILARLVAQRLSEVWGQSVIVENRTGAAGTIGGMVVARAAPDGYTLAFGGSTTFVGFELLYPDKVPYHTLKDFAPVGLVAEQTMVLAARSTLGATTLDGFVAMARAQPGKLNFAMSGIGSPPHLNMELLKQEAKIDLVTLPFAGSAPSAQALLTGTADVMMDGPQGVISLANDGRVKILAVASRTRLPELPDTPTLEEKGYPAAVKSWYALLAPRNTPAAIVAKLDADLQKALAGDAVREAMHKAGFERALLDHMQFTAMIQEQQQRLAELIRTANIKPE